MLKFSAIFLGGSFRTRFPSESWWLDLALGDNFDGQNCYQKCSQGDQAVCSRLFWTLPDIVRWLLPLCNLKLTCECKLIGKWVYRREDELEDDDRVEFGRFTYRLFLDCVFCNLSASGWKMRKRKRLRCGMATILLLHSATAFASEFVTSSWTNLFPVWIWKNNSIFYGVVDARLENSIKKGMVDDSKPSSKRSTSRSHEPWADWIVWSICFNWEEIWDIQIAKCSQIVRGDDTESRECAGGLSVPFRSRLSA